MPLSGFIFSILCLILPLLPQMYSSFENISLRIYIRQRLFDGISFASKYSSFQSAFLRGFIFDHGHLILSLLAPNYSSFRNTSLWIYIWRWSFFPISFVLKVFEFPNCVSQDLYSVAVFLSYLFYFKLFKYSKCLS